MGKYRLPVHNPPLPRNFDGGVATLLGMEVTVDSTLRRWLGCAC